MKRPSLRQLLGFSLLGLLLAVLIGAILLGSSWGKRQVEQAVRERIARNSDLVLAPFDVDFSLVRNFPDFTVSLRHFQLTDTTARAAVKVLGINHADARLEISQLLRGRVHVRHLTLYNTEFRQLTDSTGHDWGLHGRGPRRTTAATPPNFDLDSLTLVNFHMVDRNDLQNSGFEAVVHHARLWARGRSGTAQVRGTLDGELIYLRSGRGNLFEQEPVRAWVSYQYNFQQRKGTFLRTHATLNGDTVLIRGTHQAPAPGQARGTRLDLRMVGSQPLMEVLHVALPNNMQRYLLGAQSTSHARIWYTIKGLSGPTARPRTILQFQLHNAQLQWADSLRRIRRWDARGTFDNGPEHSPRTTSLSFDQCRLYSSAGELDAVITARDFTRPILSGRIRGRTELQTLAAVVAPGLWQARHGNAALDLTLNGPLPEIQTRAVRRASRASGASTPSALAVRGNITLENASFLIPSRGADMSELNVRLGLRDSSWLLENLTCRLNGMNVRANATTTYLLSYFNGQHPTTSVAGTFVVDELRLDRLRRLLAPPAGRPHRVPRPRRVGRPRNQELAARAMNLLPPGLHLNIRLQCGKLVLPADTLQQLAATVRHNGNYVQLSKLQAHVWGGSVSGAISWPTDTLQMRPVNVQLALRFNTIEYRRMLALLDRPSRATAPSSVPPDPSLRAAMLSATGQVVATVKNLRLPAGENLTNLQLRINKTGLNFQVPYLNFRTSAGGQGRVSASARLGEGQLAAAHAEVELRYGTLDVQRLLGLLAALTPPSSAKDKFANPARLRPTTSPFLDGTVTAQVRVSADRVQYAVLRGNNFRLISHLESGAARLESCSLQAFGGKVSLQGQMQTDEGTNQYPLRAQVRLQDVELPALFRVAEALHFEVLRPDNIRGTMRCEADVHTTLNAVFLPNLPETYAYLKTDLRDLELLDVEALAQALKFLRDKRTNHLYFEPVSPRFVLDGNRVIVPALHLNSNLTDLAVSGEYQLNGRANLYVGLSPMQALFGNNKKRVARIKSGEAAARPSRGLVYVNLSREPGSRYKVRPFQKQEQRQQQEKWQQQYQQLVRTQRLDTTLRLLQRIEARKDMNN
ncbi:AsmA-like C-terminal region-containing protein [Hymenobacter sp. YC55]|uniref:AsmA-like C-terminal region-containing protein n=1 Tax=Hymenobacter sp. YC55 TaxID=3034019 RepID=UPI0023F92570|nr:AsmA-like C-terminal region-containing protein [Hymenobacter sp. YC55]MDF7811097.1 AsmA-like C-terminal region-containing protein [Hymenobacter sp. YC55]